MIRDNLASGYFEWLYDLVSHRRFSERISYRELLLYLHGTEFIFLIPRDANRAEDGINLRSRYSPRLSLDEPCSVLEMMVALAIRCEEDIMDDTNSGNRTGQWFWSMIVNLGLGGMTDERFDERFVKNAVTRFLNRKYEPDGRGGLFRISDCDDDLRDVEIWYQMCWYLDSIT